MVHQYDHRFGSFIGVENAGDRPSRKYVGWYGVVPTDPNELPMPRYWVSKAEVESRLSGWSHGWMLGFRDITNSVVERTVIFTVLPRSGCSDQFGLVFPTAISDPRLSGCLLANANSIVLDYVARQKIGGTHLKKYMLYQLPILAPARYLPADIDFITTRVVELVYSAWDMKPFAEDLGYTGSPYRWDEARRALLRA